MNFFYWFFFLPFTHGVMIEKTELIDDILLYRIYIVVHKCFFYFWFVLYFSLGFAIQSNAKSIQSFNLIEITYQLLFYSFDCNALFSQITLFIIWSLKCKQRITMKCNRLQVRIVSFCFLFLNFITVFMAICVFKQYAYAHSHTETDGHIAHIMYGSIHTHML